MFRRQFLQATAASIAATAILPRNSFADDLAGGPPFKISLAEWSLHRTLRDPASNLTNLDFARVSKQEFGIDAVEYVNQFFKDKAKDESYLADMKQRAADQGVKSLLIMVDGEGNLGDPDDAARTKAIENHHQWVEAAKFLGCHSIRVNAASRGSYEEQQEASGRWLASAQRVCQADGPQCDR